jgi:hypothetical protein
MVTVRVTSGASPTMKTLPTAAVGLGKLFRATNRRERRHNAGATMADYNKVGGSVWSCKGRRWGCIYRGRLPMCSTRTLFQLYL